MARSTVKTKGCFEAAIGLTDAEARAIEKIAEAKGFKTTNTNNDYARATEKVLADAKAQRSAIIEQIAKLDPQAAQTYAVAQEQPAPAANDDLDAMFDEIVAQESVNEAHKAPRAPRATPDVTETDFGKTAAPRAPRTATQAAKSAAKNAASGIANTIDALGALFSTKPGTLGSGPVFNEDTYAAAKPLFVQAVADLKASGQDIREVMQAVIRMVMAKFGADTVAQMKPYIVKFTQDVRDGRIDISQPNTENEAENGTGTEESTNGPAITGQQGTQALGGMAPGEDVGAQGVGGIRGSDTGRVTGSAPDDSGTHGPRVSGTRSGGSGSTSVRAPAPGKERGRGRRGTAGTGSQLPEERSTVPVDLFNQPTEPVSVNNIQAVNFRITEDVRLGQGGEAEKFRDNIAAIRTLKAIEAEGRRATSAEQRTLARYVGWGGLANAFPNPESKEWKDEWKIRGAELQGLLTKKEYDLARRSTLDSHYTSHDVVSAMWAAAKRLGFKGGMAAETSMGVGNFLGLIPEDLSGATKFLGVEYDSLTSRIGALLYPQATVLNSGIQDVPLADGAFDLNIGNPPFGDQSLRFQFKPELNRVSIHNQFFLAGVDSLKPGGLQLNVVSRYLLDAMDKTTRTMLAKKAKLVGAIRLPDTAFKENARTSVVTDIVVLQRLTPGEEAEMAAAFEAANSSPLKEYKKEQERKALAAMVPEWVEVGKMADPLGGEPMPVNRYFVANPGMILGTLERSGSMQFKNDITVRPGSESLSDALAKAVAKLPEGIMNRSQEAVDASIGRFKAMSDALRISLSGQEAGSIAFTPDGTMEQVYERETPEGGYELAKRPITESTPWSERLFQDAKGNWYTIEAKLDAEGKPEKVQKNGKPTNLNVYERKLYPSEADIPASMLLGEKDFSRLSKLVKLRDLMVAQINLETEDAPSDKMEANRALLAAAYASFVAEEGVISRPTNSKLVSNMPDGALVQALELSYRKELTAAQARKLGESPRPESAEPAPIMSKRVIPKYEPPTHAQSPADALSIVLSESGRVDIDRMASLLGKTNDEVIGEMFDSADKPLIFKDPETEQWVTRNDYLTGQVKKKLHAAQAANLPKHIAELEAVQPEPWGAENVTVLLGASFVPPQIYADFVQHVTGKPARVSFSQATNSYSVMSDGTATVEKNDEFGADGISITEMVTALLNSTAIKVTYRDDDGTHIDKEKTDLALIKAKQIASEFTDWSFADSDRRRTLVNLFNEKYNTRVSRQHDGSHLMLPGKVPDAILKMRRHQKNAIWRGISERFMLLDHVVGAGKTFTAIARAMERRRMGLSRKPAIIVPNHMVEQFTSDVYRLYPGAKVLAAGNKDFEKKNRRKLFAKIASGDWDVVIIPHSSFGKIGIAPETELRYLEKELEIAEQAIKEAWEESDEQEGGYRKPFNVKQAERLREKITTRMAALKGDNNKDRLLTFEQLGIDDLTVDEAHEFKNLFYSSRLTGVKGMGNPSGSQKAFDLYSKVRVLRESPTGTVTFMTGTPISNSAVEMFTMMRYLAADELKELGLEHFDAWRSQFVSTDAGWEPNETGRLKEVSRLGRSWSNMRSLMDLYYSFTDSVGNEDIKKAYAEDNNGAAFPIPKVKGGDRQSVVVQPTKDQIVLLEQTIEDFDSLPGIEDPYERNKERLRLMDRARKVSLDVRAAVPGHQGAEKGGKLEKISEEVKRIYDKWSADRGTQLIFLDRSVPKAKGDDTLIKQYDALVAERLAALNANDEEGLRRASDKLEAFDADEMEQLRIAQSGGWNAYQQIKDNLIASGIPSNEIRFIQEAGNDAQKQALFDAVKAGEVRVLLGSTQRMGAGTNVQDRLVGLHHGDVTWKPSDIEQREGRIIRQGNKLLEKYGIDTFEVEVLAYATERTIDAKMWSLNASKLKTINAIRNYDGAFSMDFEDEDSVSMAELAALASGNPLLLERVKLDSDINRLELLRKQHTRKMWGYTGRLDDAERAIKYGKPESERYTAWHKEALAGQEEVLADNAARVVTVEGKEYKGHSEAAQAVKASVEQQQAGDESAKFSVKVGERRLTSMNGALDAIYDALGDTDPFLGTLAGDKFISRSAFARQIAKNAAAAASGMENGESKIVATGKMGGFSFEASLSRSAYSGSYVVDMALVDAEGKTVSTTSSNGYSDPKFTASMFTRQIGELGYAIRPSDLAYRAKRALDDAARAEKELPELRELAQTPFAHADELKQKQARLEEVITALSVDPVAAAPDQEPEANGEEGDAPAFSRSTGQSSDQDAALKAFSEADDLFSLPKSKSKDIEQIARDNGENAKVRTGKVGSETLHTITFENGIVVRIFDRPASPYGNRTQIYAMDLVDGNASMTQIGRPGENPEDVPETDDVYLDVSMNIPAKYGSIAYNIAATYAHNNGRIFIGDPNGLTDHALRRRTEQMLSSALKFGTTDHLAPHPRQVAGDAKLGVPPLKWVYGDHIGNIERMIDVSLDSLENGAIGAKDDTRYDPSTGGFTDKSGQVVPRKSSMGRDMASYRAGIDKAQAGWRTYARSAFLRSFLGSNGRAEGSGILDRAINDVSRISSNGVGGGAYPRTERIFYSRDGAKGSEPASSGTRGAKNRALDLSRVTSIVDAIRTTWKNAPEIVVASSMHDAVIPERVRSYNDEQMSLGATGDPQGFVYGGKVYLVADQLSTPGHVVEVLFHEALGHIGLRGVFGDSLKQVLNQVVLARRAEVRAKAAQYGFAVNNEDDMRRAAEEVLAEMAQTYPELGIVQRAIAAIRTWLRENIPQLKSMKLTDAEIVRNFILPARAFVERGGNSSVGGMVAFARRDDAGSDIPNVIIGNPIGSGKANEDYQAAKAGDTEAAVRLAKVLVTPDLLTKIKSAIDGETPVVVGVFSIEAAGRNQLPNAAAVLVAEKLGLEVGEDIIQASSPKRTTMNGLDRIFNTPEFDGAIESGRSYLLIDDTVTQGATFAALASHIKDGGGKIAGVVALTGKEYSATIKPSSEILSKLREKYADLESTFKAATGYGFDGLTQSEARYLANFEPAVTVRNRIIEAGQQAVDSSNTGTAGELDSPLDGGDTPMFSRSATMSATANKVVDKLNEHFSHDGTMSWWHKSFGSPYNLAQKSAPFKRVFTSAQDFLNDVSFYANEAADHASKLLPKLESWKDIGKSPISAADNKAIEAPIFEGTLSWARDEAGKAVKIADLEARYADLSDEDKAGMLLRKRIVTEAQLKRWKASQLDIYSGAIRNRFEATFLRPGVVWSDAELKSIFNLTPEQADLYRQFHAAVGTSLDNLAKSEMLRYGGNDVADLRDMVLDAPTADDAAILLRDHLLQLADEDQSRADILTDMANGMVERADKVNKLKKEGYAPLSRFGQYSVDVVVDGERQYFGLFETKADANQMADKLREEFGAENVESGTMAQQKFELYKGITPESLELFGNMLGLDSTGDKESDKAFQEYLKLTKNNRSAMKRLIHRHGIAGYSTDTGRVLAAFIYSNARQTAAGLHMGEMSDAVNAIPKQQGQLSDYATRYADYVKNPQEEAQAIRGLMFAQYLGGNVASAFVNFTQPMTVSFPYLSQFAGIKGAAAALGRAMADQRTGEYEKDLLEALRIADEQGVTQPQSVHELQAQARGAATLRPGDGTRRGDAVAMASNALSKLSLGWGKLFGMAEQVNRRTTFIAAYRIAVEKGLPNPGAFATKAVDETQFINNKGNRARAARGVLGSTVMTFKSYSINYMELLHRMGTQGGPEGKRAVALAMVMLFLMAGAGGLPFVEDLDDLIDGIAQRMGYNFSTKKAKQEFLEHWLGKAGAQFVDRGLTGIAGVPIDVAGRMGMGNLIPGTGVFMPKADHTKDGLELLGVGADMAKRIMTGAGQVLDGQVVDGALTVAPKAVGNLAQGFRMLDKGYYQDTKGAKVIDTTTTEGVFKSLGFQPQSVALVGQSNWISQSAKNLYTLNAQAIRAQWAKGIFENDPDQVNDARERMRSWNEKNPDLRIDPNMPAIIKKVREMRKTKAERIADTAPKAMRAQLRKDIAESHQP